MNRVLWETVCTRIPELSEIFLLVLLKNARLTHSNVQINMGLRGVSEKKLAEAKAVL